MMIPAYQNKFQYFKIHKTNFDEFVNTIHHYFHPKFPSFNNSFRNRILLLVINHFFDIIKRMALTPEQAAQMKEALHKFFFNDDESNLPTVFGFLNTSGTGNLTPSELENTLGSLFSDYITKTEIHQMVVDADEDKNGSIEIGEFIAVMKKQKSSGGKSGWSRMKMFDDIGGSEGVAAIVNKMYEKIQANDKLMPYFEGKNIQGIVDAQLKYFESAVGGPSPWSGRTLPEIHASMGITEDIMNLYATLFGEAALESGKTPEQAESLKNLVLGFSGAVRGDFLNEDEKNQMRDALHAFFWNDDEGSLPTAFGLLNKSGTGSLTAAELYGTLGCLFSDYISKHEIDQMIVDADEDKSGTIEIQEFIDCMKKQKSSGAESGWNRLKMFDQIGGSEGVAAIVGKMYEKVKADPDLMSFFEGKDVQGIVAAQCKYLSGAVGGPVPWTGRNLVEIHTGMNIPAAAFDKYATLFQEAAVESGKTPEEAEGVKNLIMGFKPKVAGI